LLSVKTIDAIIAKSRTKPDKINGKIWSVKRGSATFFKLNEKPTESEKSNLFVSIFAESKSNCVVEKLNVSIRTMSELKIKMKATIKNTNKTRDVGKKLLRLFCSSASFKFSIIKTNSSRTAIAPT